MSEQSSSLPEADSSDERLVIVGGGLAGAKAAQALRENGFAGTVTLIAAEPHLPYERPPLSKGYLQGKQDVDSTLVHPRQWYEQNRIDLRMGVAVTSIDRGDKSVVLTGGERLPYSRLLLATGSVPRRLPLPGADLDGVLVLRVVEDSDALKEQLRPDVRVVLIGGGWIGLETAAAARLAGAQVTVLEREELPLLAALGSEAAGVFADLHRDHGVDLRTGVGVAALVGNGSGRVHAVRLQDGTQVPADLVVVGVGAAPVTDLAVAAGLDVENGVLVDAHLRTSDPDIFAAGDVANAVHPVLGGRVRVEHWANALNQPAIAAASMLGQDVVYDRLPYFYSDQYDLGMEYTGYVGPDGYDRVVFRGDVPGREFIAFWLRDGRVLAGMNVNVWDVTDDIKALIGSGKPVDADRLADAEVPLADLIG